MLLVQSLEKSINHVAQPYVMTSGRSLTNYAACSRDFACSALERAARIAVFPQMIPTGIRTCCYSDEPDLRPRYKKNAVGVGELIGVGVWVAEAYFSLRFPSLEPYLIASLVAGNVTSGGVEAYRGLASHLANKRSKQDDLDSKTESH